MNGLIVNNQNRFNKKATPKNGFFICGSVILCRLIYRTQYILLLA